MKTYKREIITIIKNQFGIQDVNEADELKLLGIDSLGSVMLIAAIEETFDIEFSMAELNPAVIKTVKDVINIANKHLGGKRLCG